MIVMRNMKSKTEDSQVLQGLRDYWNERSESYSRQNVEEMNCWRKMAWRDLILENVPDWQGIISVLDVGTGPGFFAMNLAQAGCQVSAVDVTREMLALAEKNARDYDVAVDFRLYDGKYLPFDDDSFDLVVSRNVLWNVEEPVLALQEWKRVLKAGGRMVYFDANWYLYLKDEETRKAHEEAHRRLHELYPDYVHDPLGEQRARDLEELALSLPLTGEKRPAWDKKQLEALGMHIVRINPDIAERVFDEAEKIHYAASPVFMVYAEKPGR